MKVKKLTLKYFKVRRMTSILLRIGINKDHPNLIKGLLEEPSKLDMRKIFSLPADGLFLMNVEYEKTGCTTNI